jgi:hypothetical protein
MVVDNSRERQHDESRRVAGLKIGTLLCRRVSPVHGSAGMDCKSLAPRTGSGFRNNALGALTASP